MIRLATKKDAKRLLELFNSDNNLRGEDIQSMDYRMGNMVEYLENKKGKIFVFEENKRILGALFAEFHYDYVYLAVLIINKSARGRGIATMLMNKLEEEMKKKKIGMIEAFTEENNAAMQKLLTKLNYKRGKKFVYYSKFK